MVNQLLEQHKQNGPPVRIEEISSNLGLEIRAGDLGEVSGLLARSGNGATIGVNSTQSRERRRFTIAHELGHYLLHEGMIHHVDHNYRLNYRSSESAQATNVEEIEANFFAASLLMPKKFLALLNAIEALDDDKEVEKLAKLFDVSRHAMSLRLVNLYRRYLPY
ncbi:MAG TPA: ImmA/IrrE family metallo-endopeptidase [Sphingomicrobium sp.]|nr:ImmA/IrrE family metallo-endopeptidase [Sphingomicrobium sp.]